MAQALFSNGVEQLKNNTAKLFITLTIVGSTAISVIADWNDSHLFNPHWPSHAVYHGLLFLNLLIGTSMLGIWMIWRKSKEPYLGVDVAIILHCIYRASFFYLGFILPQASVVPNRDALEQVGGITVYPNVIISGFFILLLFAGRWFYRAEQMR